MKTKATIAIDVPDLKQAVSFYTKALGFELKRDGEKNVIITMDDFDVWLLKHDTGSNPLPHGAATRTYERHWTPVHLDFEVSNVDELVSKVITQGGLHEGGESGEWGKIAHCADPFGHGFCLIQMAS